MLQEHLQTLCIFLDKWDLLIICFSFVVSYHHDLYACKWKVDGSEIKLPVNSKIEIVNVDDSEDSEEIGTPNFRERQNLALKDYNTKLKVI